MIIMMKAMMIMVMTIKTLKMAMVMMDRGNGDDD